jgi:hypothetical protein
VANATIFAADFTGLTPGAVSSLPSGLSFSRASAATVQIGTSTVVTSGITTDVARAGRALDADSVGLVVEPSRTNLVLQSRTLNHANAGSGDTYTTGQTSPDGSTNALRAQINSSGFSRYQLDAGITGTFSMSVWYAKGPGSGVYHNSFSTTAGASGFAFGTASASWGRVAIPAIAFAAQNRYALPMDGQNESALGGPGAAALDALVDMHQIEAGKWVSEFVSTSGATATRAGERLFVATGASVVSSGRVLMHLRAQLKHTPANADTAMRLWTDHADATTYVEIATTGVLTASVGGSTNTTNALSWAANDTVDIFVAAGGGIATIVKYRVNGGATTTCTITGSALGTIAPSGAIDLLCDASTAKQPGCRVYTLAFYRSGAAPAWAA